MRARVASRHESNFDIIKNLKPLLFLDCQCHLSSHKVSFLLNYSTIRIKFEFNLENYYTVIEVIHLRFTSRVSD